MSTATPGKRDEQSTLLRRLLCLVCVLFPLLWPGPASAGPPIHVSFKDDEVGKPPHGWVSRDKNPGQVYSVQAEGGRRYLHADARDASMQLGFEKQWPLGEYPLLQWQWRAVLFPAHSDERKNSGADSVLGVYVVFGRWPFIESIKYIWSDTLPVGETFSSPFSSRSKIIVVRSGPALAGTWVTERRDALSDYRRLFNDPAAAPVARGIAVLTDSDNTHSRAAGDYAAIETLAPAPQELRSAPTGP